jgi:hypothetical protein
VRLTSRRCLAVILLAHPRAGRELQQLWQSERGWHQLTSNQEARCTPEGKSLGFSRISIKNRIDFSGVLYTVIGQPLHIDADPFQQGVNL